MKTEHTLAQLCAAFEVKRSGYHAWVQADASPHERTDAQLLPKIRAVHRQHQGRYGAPRIQAELAGQGERHGGKRIARLMKADGLLTSVHPWAEAWEKSAWADPWRWERRTENHCCHPAGKPECAA